MKKLFAILLAVLLLASCGAAETANTESEAPSVTPSLPDGASSAEVSVPDTESVLSEELVPGEESAPSEESAPAEESTPPEEEQGDPEKDWTSIEVTGFAFMDTGLGELYRDVLNSYEEWEAFRDEYLQGEDCRYLYFPETFEHCKVIVLAWMEGYHDTRVEYVSFVQNGDRAEATFLRYPATGIVPDVCGTKLFLLQVPKDCPITEGEQVTITVKEGNPYADSTAPVDILAGWQEGEGCLMEAPSQVTFLTTVEEKDAFFAVYGEDMGLEDRYDEQFFAKRRLLAVYSIQGSGSNSIEPVKLLLHPDGSLEVVMLLTTPGDFGWEGTADVVEYLFLLPVPAYLFEDGTPDVTVEPLRLKNKIHVIYDLTAEELQSFVSATGEDSFPWDADTFRPGEDFLEPPVFHRWEDVICRFDCTPEGFAAELAEYGFTERIENITYFMDLGSMPVIWLQTEEGEYFITYSIGYGGEEFTFWRGEKFREHYAKRECKVTVDGKEIESAVPAVMYGGYADVPLLPILKAFGAEVTQPSPQEATAVIGDKTYYLDLVNMTFREEYEEEDWELGILRAGGYGTIYPVDGDVMMEYSMLWDLLREEFGLNCTIQMDSQGLTVAFFSVK